LAIATRLQIISVGNSVPVKDTRFTIHSAFQHVVNLLHPEGIVSLVSKEIGGGPNNIVLSGFNFLQLKSAKIEQGNLILDGVKTPLSEAEVYSSSLELNNTSKTAFLSGLQIFERILIRDAHPLSSAFLLDGKRGNFFITPFEKNLRDRLKGGIDKILNGKLSIIKEFRGLGFGFTPQGDDIINGMLSALYVYQLLTNHTTAPEREKIYRLAKGGNIIANTFLYFAFRGEFFERFKFLISSLFEDKNSIISATKRLLAIGATSGADIGVGFILSSRKIFETGGMNGNKRNY